MGVARLSADGKRTIIMPNGSVGGGGAAPPEPPLSPRGKSYYTPGDDPREGKDPLAKKDRRN